MILDIVHSFSRENKNMCDIKKSNASLQHVENALFSQQSNENSRINIHRVSSQCTPVSFPLLGLFYFFSAYALQCVGSGTQNRRTTEIISLHVGVTTREVEICERTTI